MRIMVDIDGCICTDTKGKYEKAKPYPKRIAKINKLYDKGNFIIYWTARGATTGIDWIDLTLKQFKEWGVKYHALDMNKPFYDLVIDDKGRRASEFFKK